MAINKTVNKSTKTHGAMRNCMEYVLRDSKINSSLVYVSGPFDAEEITYDTVYRIFLEEKNFGTKTPAECTPTILFRGIRMRKLHRRKRMSLARNLWSNGLKDSRR